MTYQRIIKVIQVWFIKILRRNPDELRSRQILQPAIAQRGNDQIILSDGD